MTQATPAAFTDDYVADVLKDLHHYKQYRLLAERQGMNLCSRAAKVIEALQAGDKPVMTDAK